LYERAFRNKSNKFKNHIGIPAAEITLSILTQEDEEK